MRIESGTGRRSVYSGKYALSSIVYCAHCGDIYQRTQWLLRGEHVPVWRCVSRLQKRRNTINCPSRTVYEKDLHAAVVEAINKLGLQIDMKMIEHDFQRFLTGNHLLSFLFRKCLYDKTDNLYILHVKGTEAINRLISHILDEYNRMEAYSTNSCICYTENLFYEILRNLENENVSSSSMDRRTERIASVILNEIYQNYDTVSMRSLCEKFNYSESYLWKIIKEYSGSTFTDIVKKLRISRALQLLENRDIKICDIARITGFSSQNHFARSFRQETGMSPTQFRAGKTKGNE